MIGKGGNLEALLTELSALETEETDLSLRRHHLHDRIHSLQSNGANPSSPKLAALIVEERALSDRRRELHQHIDELSVKVDHEPGPPKRQPLIGP